MSFDWEPSGASITAGTGLQLSGSTLSLAPLSPSPAGAVTSADIEVDEYGRTIAASDGAGGGGGGDLSPILLWDGGGGIGAWQVWPFGGSYTVSYAPIGSSSSLGAHDFALRHSVAGGTVKVRFEYDADLDLLVTPRIRSAAGSWSSGTAQTLDLADSEAEFTVTLAAGEQLGLHVAPQGGGAVSLNHLRIFAGPA